MNKKKIISIILFIIILFSIIFIFIFYKKNKKDIDKIISVEALEVSQGTVTNELKTKGEILFSDISYVYAESDCEVEDVLIKVNDNVKKNQILIKFKNINKDRLEKELKEAKLNLESAKIALSNSKVPITDIDLEKEKLNITRSEQNVKETEFNLEQININIEQQERFLKDAKKNLSDTQILFDVGAVTKNNLDTVKTEVDKLEDSIRVMNNQKKQIEQNINTAKLNLKMAQKQFEDFKVKYDSNKNSNKNTIKQQEILVEKNKLQIKQIEDELKLFKKESNSPVNGVILAVSTNKSESVHKGKQLVEIANTDNYKIVLNVNEKYINKIKLGQKVNIEGAFLRDEILTGKISKISYIAKVNKENNLSSSSTERTVQVEVKLDDEEKYSLLKAGFSIDTTVITEVKENVIVIPIMSLLVDKDDKNFVYIINSNNLLEKRNIEVGLFSNMTVEVNGISEGEIIVAQPVSNIEEGMKVNPILNNNI